MMDLIASSPGKWGFKIQLGEGSKTLTEEKNDKKMLYEFSIIYNRSMAT